MPRIVSLIASATEIVHALGLGPFQVGRSHECDYPASVLGLPVCTKPRFSVSGNSFEIDRKIKETLANAASVYEVFPDVLERLAPTVIITQSQCRVCAVTRDDVELALSAKFLERPSVVALEPNSLADLWVDIERVAEACHVDRHPLIRDLRARMAAIESQAAEAKHRPRIACIEWHEPLMAAGNWVPELVELAGGHNLFGAAGIQQYKIFRLPDFPFGTVGGGQNGGGGQSGG